MGRAASMFVEAPVTRLIHAATYRYPPPTAFVCLLGLVWKNGSAPPTVGYCGGPVSGEFIDDETLTAVLDLPGVDLQRNP